MSKKSKWERQVRENKIRRVCHRRGLRVIRSSLHDPLAIGYRGWMIADMKSGAIKLGNDGHPFSATMEDVEGFLGIVS